MKKMNSLKSNTVNETSQSGSIDPNQLQQMMNNGMFNSGTIPMMNNFDMNATNEESLEDKNIVPENINESDNELKAETREYPDRRILSTIPLYIKENIIEEKYATATLVFLCKDINGNLFTLGTNFGIDSKKEIEYIKQLPFYENKEIINNMILNSILVDSLDSYVTDFDFKLEKEELNNLDPTITITAKNIKSEDDRIIIAISAEHFAAMCFVSSYITEGITNQHDLELAMVTGAKIQTPATFFVVDKIESIVSMSAAVKSKSKLFAKNKDSSSIAVVMKVSRYINANDRETAYILEPFEMDKVYKASKFKGKTVDNVIDNYYGDADQFISTLLMNDIKLEGIDKEYMIIRGKSKNTERRLFLFDSSVQEELINMINEY